MRIAETTAIVVASLLGLAACSDKECETKDDCPSGQLCDGLGVCYTPNISTPDPVDVGFADADGGVETDADTGVADADTGVADTGIADAGTGIVDTGVADGGVTPVGPSSTGLLWAGELTVTAGTEFELYGEFIDRSSATYDTQTQSIPDLEGGTCTLKIDKLVSGQPTGYFANSLTVATGSRTAPPSISLPYVGGGLFQPPEYPPPQLFSNSPTVVYGIVEAEMAGSLQSQLAQTEPPKVVFAVSPPEGSPVILAGGPQLMWSSGAPMTDMITIELFDTNRDVVVTCKTPNDGSYAFPSAAVDAFIAASPTAPWALDIRHDKESVQTVSTDTVSFDATFRASWGVRFTAL